MVLVVAALFRLWNLSGHEYGNIYYAAAVKSMAASWRNFFFASFDPAGFVTLDKPPVAFWLQALAVRLFGYHGLTLHLPQVIEGLLAVALVYYLTRRVVGECGALVAGMVMALNPASVAADRSNLLDSCLVLALLLSAWALLRATQSGRTRWLLLSVGLVGLAFNIKFTAAFLVLPTYYLLYWAAAPVKRWTRLAQLTAATMVLAVVSLSWPAIVDFTPASSRPFVANTSDNSAISLALGRNALERIAASMGSGPGFRGAPGPGQGPNFGPKRGGPPPFAKKKGPGFRRSGPDGPPQFGSPGPAGRAGLIGSRPTTLTGHGGRPEWLRLTNRDLAGHIAWLVPFAAIGVLGLALTSRSVVPRTALHQTVWLWCGWAGTYAVVFSFLQGPVHPYYLALLSPPVAALTGIGAVELWKVSQRGGWWLLLPVAAVTLTALGEWRILDFFPPWKRWLLPVLLVGAVGSVIALCLAQALRKRGNVGRWLGVSGIAIGLVALLVSPGMWAATPALAPGGRMIPLADPELLKHREMPSLKAENRKDVQFLASFLQKNHCAERFLMATPNIHLAAAIIIETGEPVMVYGGFGGRDPILDRRRFAAMVRAGELRFVMLQGGGPGGRTRPGAISDIETWVRQHAKAVPPALWRRATSYESPMDFTGWGPTERIIHRMFRGPGAQLYDCRPDEAQPPAVPAND